MPGNQTNNRGSSLAYSRWFAVAVGIPTIAGLIHFVFITRERSLTPLETTCQALLILVISLLATFYAAQRLPKNQELRRASLLVEDIANDFLGVKEDIQGALQRMTSRVNLEPSVYQMLWEEIVNGIVLKLDTLGFKTRKSVEDWRKFGRFVEPLEQENVYAVNLRKQLWDVYEEIDKLACQPTDVESTISALRDKVRSLEQKQRRIRDRYVLQGGARQLLASGSYEEAVEAYTRMIEWEPAQYAHFLGRARVYYITGNVAAALADLDAAQRLAPNNPAIQNMRDQITRGVPLPDTQNTYGQLQATRGHRELSLGHGEEALRHFTQAREAGLIPPFDACNRAMAYILLGDKSSALKALGDLDMSRARIHMTVIAESLRALATSLDEDTPNINTLKLALARAARLGEPFSLYRGPLQYLKAGLETKGTMTSTQEMIFDLLKPPSPEDCTSVS